MDRLVLRDGVCNRPRDQLFDLLSGRARPRTTGNSNSDRNVRIFALRHGLVAEPAPNQDADQQHPGNLWVFHEESRSVSRLLDSVGIALMCHDFAVASTESLKENRRPSRAVRQARRLFLRYGLPT